jgi:hypothetical protein
MRQFSLGDLFPAYQTHELEPQHIGLLQLCTRIGIPFPVERARAHASWWRMLHKIGHFAVKPDWYLQYARYLNDELAISQGGVYIAGGTVKGLPSSITIPNAKIFVGDSDALPDAGLHKDPTLDGREAYLWAQDFIRLVGWAVPDGLSDKGIIVRSRAYYRRRMAEWAVDVRGAILRPRDARNRNRFSLPYPRPRNHAEMAVNATLIHAMGGVNLTKTERTEWAKWTAARWSDRDLFLRAERTKYQVPLNG